MNSIDFRRISKCYPLYESPADRLRELASFNRKQRHREFWALRDISFAIARGEAFCIIGQNGSGKSTLLQIIAGVLQPTSGASTVTGRVAALLELGSGFNPEFTGRQNVYLNASILGLSRKDIDSRYDAIVDFAEIGRFIDQPVKTYSSGMAVRLAFSVAIHVDPEVLLVDEALAVGDHYFRQRCMRRISALRQRGVTIVFVSHSMTDVKAVGDRTLWVDHGHVRELGDTDLVVSKYMAAVETNGHRAKSFLAGPSPARSQGGRGHGCAEILEVSLLDAAGNPALLLEPATPITVRIVVSALSDLRRPRVGFVMRNHVGLEFAALDTAPPGVQLAPIPAGEQRTVEFHVDLPHIYPAHFSFSPFISDDAGESATMCDWIDNALTVEAARGDRPVYGYIHVPCRVDVNARLHPHEHRVHR